LHTDGQTKVTFEEILQFVSGADQIPVLGFDKQPTLYFFTPVHNVRRLPYASMCDIRLYLPRGVESDELTTMLEQSIVDSCGFGVI